MNLKTTLCIAAAAMAMLPGVSSAKGCLKGAAVGGLGGHVAGGHGVLGAAAGCVVGRHIANKQDKQQQQQQQAAKRAPATQPQPVPATRS
jgi:outer membrane lipoprotein SlyB